MKLAKTTKEIKRVAFFGDAELSSKDEAYILAYDTAYLLAKNGYIIVNGGGPGIMAAATLGAKKAQGKVELVVLDPKKEPKNYEGIYKENYDYAQKVYSTDNYPARLNKLIEIADAFVIFKGGTGTLSEVGLVWEMAKFEYGNHEPLVFVGNEWAGIIPKIEEEMKYENKEKRVAAIAKNPEEVLRLLQRGKLPENLGVFKKTLIKLRRLIGQT